MKIGLAAMLGPLSPLVNIYDSFFGGENTINKIFKKSEKTAEQQEDADKKVVDLSVAQVSEQAKTNKILTEGLFEIAKRENLKVAVTVSNLTLNKVEFKYLTDFEYEDFIDWMWASTCFVPFMSIVDKNGFEYADGGFGNYIPIEEAIDAGATEVDVIILRPKHQMVRKTVSRNPFDILLNSMDFMLQQISRNDIHIAQLESIYNPNIKIRQFFTPRVLTEHSFYFYPKLMKKWWQEGIEHANTIVNNK